MISIVIPLYNKAQSIPRTLDSVLAQTYTDYEVIVVNDGSTDGSDKVVEDYIKSQITNHQSQITNHKSPIRLINKPNGGVCSARNRGIKETKGEYIALLDADDLWDKDYLAEQVKMIHDFPEAAMWGINFAEVTDGNKLVRKLATGLPNGYRGYVEHYFEMKGRVSDLFHSSAVVVRRDAFEIVGKFDERIKIAEDDDMWWRIIARNRVAFYDRYMVQYQQDTENRALQKKHILQECLPYYVDKYRISIFKENTVFYRWVMRWAANRIRIVYFEDKGQYADAKVATNKLDYSVLPWKYRLFFLTPQWLGRLFNKLDKQIKK